MEEKVVLVTGATGHLGPTIAKRLAQDYGRLALHYFQNLNKAEALKKEISELGPEVETFQADLTEEKGCADLIDKVIQKFGSVDIVINLPGAIKTRSWDELDQDDWEEIFRSNLESSYFCLKHALKSMRSRKWGRIINIGFHRVEHLGSYPGVTPYAVAKTGLLILTRTAAVAEVGNNITVNMISPGLMEGGQLPSGLKLKEGQIGRAEDVAEAVAFISSERASKITGANLLVAGTWKM
ncbi:MAG: SDR family oxidoreductase [Acidobacteriota bacterium]|nr:SDR family oxidoreductase [Acidobacteriota bacterium]MDW3229877.1 SDR family oxidoreductase [Acidobacteriota bacterium]MDY0231539.1 SDR family oxidoreductase [Candidatus Saccharicenans sp.]